jgi:cbb3-type cytochrome oxidase subunit 3
MWSVTAIIIATITSFLTVCMSALFLIYYFWLLKKVKEKHAFEMEAVVLSSSHKGTITNENV